MSVKYEGVAERMRSAGKLKNDSRLARALGITPQAISNYKKRGNLPADLLVRFSDLYGVSIDWLITGDGESFLPGFGEGTDVKTLNLLKSEVTVTPLSPDELVYVGQLLKILRKGNDVALLALKSIFSSFTANELPPTSGGA